MGLLQRVWHANRGRLLLRTPGPVPLGLAYVLLVETNLFPNLSLFYRTMLFEYPSVLSRFCFIVMLYLVYEVLWWLYDDLIKAYEFTFPEWSFAFWTAMERFIQTLYAAHTYIFEYQDINLLWQVFHGYFATGVARKQMRLTHPVLT